MARTIATVGGVALKPGVSLNRRWYTRPMIAATVQQAQQAIEAGTAVVRDLDDDPLSSLTHHGAGDDSTRIVGRLTSLALDEDGSARYEMALADTPHARTIAALADTSDGKPAFLRGVSIRGAWTGTVRKVKGPDGRPVETADGLELDGLDFTRSPGVPGAGVDTFAWADRTGRSETTERVLIFESVPEAHVTAISEETTPAADAKPAEAVVPVVPDTLQEALRAVNPVPHILENGLCVICEAAVPMGKRGSGLSGAGHQWADPGYQADKKQRYDVSTKDLARAGWGYINQKDNADKYTAQQLKRIKGKIKAALKRFGVKVSSESAGWTIDAPAMVTEALAEYYGSPDSCGSWSVNAANGPVSICMSSYGMDPDDLDVILRAAADAACAALKSLDPDMDGDIDLPGAPASDTDHDGGESAPGDDLTETDPEASPAATTETEAPAMSEPTTTPAAEAAPAIDPKVLQEAVSAALAQQDEARRARKAAAKRAAQEAAAAKVAAGSAALGTGIPATAGATVSETAEQRVARLEKLAEEKLAERMKAEGLPAEETDEQILDRLIEAKLTPLRQARAEAGGGVQRKGHPVLDGIAENSADGGRALREASITDLAALAAAGYKGARPRA